MSLQYAGTLSRLEEMLKSDSILGPKISDFRVGESGERDGDTFANSYPACILSTPPSPFATSEEYGRSHGMDIQSTTFYTITLVSNKPTPRESKLEVLSLVGDVVRILRSNPTFMDADGEDPMCVRSVIESIQEMTSMRGRMTQASTITIRCQAGSQKQIHIPGVGTIPVLFTPVSREYVAYAPHLSTSGTLSGYSPTYRSNMKYFEVEDTGIYEELKAVRDDFRLQDIRLVTGDKSETFEAHLSSVNQGQAYDGIPTITLQFEVVN